MSGSSWDLVIPVLGIGLAMGGLWVFWWRKRNADSRSSDRDRQLLAADLEARQALLYEQLHEAGEGERDELELAAARNLKALEEVGGGQRPAEGEAPAASTPAPPSVPAPAPGRGSRAWLGFVGGVACAGLVWLLIVWAQRDAQPRMDTAAPPPPAGG